MKLDNIIYAPSKITTKFWVYCKDEAISQNYPENDGKWMMFFPIGRLSAE